jgi:thioredoxin-dependent peroxiredoxin
MDRNQLLYKIFKPIDMLLNSHKGERMLKVGDTAPDFKVKTHDGKTATLKDFAGKTVVLWFYPKADTPGCTAEGCAFRDRMAAFKEKNAVLLGVSFDTPEENMKFAEKFRFEFPLLCDVNREIGIAYGAAKTKEDKHANRIAYVIDGKGKVQATYPKVDAANFPEQVLGTL